MVDRYTSYDEAAEVAPPALSAVEQVEGEFDASELEAATGYITRIELEGCHPELRPNCVEGPDGP